MKKINFILCIFLAFSSFGQVNKGQWLTGGSAAINFQNVDESEYKSTTINISPNIGYFFMYKLAAGLRGSFDWTKSNALHITNTFFTGSPFIRYYFLPASHKLNVFGDASYGWGANKSSGNTTSFNKIAITAGPAFFLSPQTALEFTLQYSSVAGDFGPRSNTIGFNVGFQIHFGKRS